MEGIKTANELTVILTDAELDLFEKTGLNFGLKSPSGIVKKLLIDKLNSKPVKAVKIEHEWQDMNCKGCSRFQTQGECDFHGPVSEWNYCEDFIPRSTFSKQKILQMWQDHTQRFIKEPREHGRY